MKIKLTEHQQYLILLEKIEDKISELKDPFVENIIEYKKYIDLLSATINALSNTIYVDKEKIQAFRNDSFNNIQNELNLITQNIYN